MSHAPPSSAPSNPYKRGFGLALEGLKLAQSSPEVGRAYLKVAGVIFALSLIISGGGIWALWTFAVPPADAAWWWSIGAWLLRVLGSLGALLVGPILAIFTVNIAFPLFNRGVFMAGLRAIDPARADAIDAHEGMPVTVAAAIATRRLAVFVGLSLMFFVVGLIPVIGIVLGPLGQLWLGARTLSWELLDPYFDCLDIRYAEQREIVDAHKKTLLGFGLPIALIFAFPLLGPLLFGLAQAAGAVFVARELPVDPREAAP